MDRGTIPINQNYEFQYAYYDRDAKYKYFNRKFEIILVEKKTLKKNQDKPLSSNLIEEALLAKDPVTIEVVKEAQYYLGILTANLVNVLDPDVVVFGGGLVEQLGETFLVPIRETARSHYLQQKGAEKVRIVASTLGDHAGTIGAAEAARRKLKGS